MIFNAPLSSWRADQLIDLLQLSPDARVLEVGCGNGEFLLRTTDRWGCSSIGIDIDADAIAEAQRAAESRNLPAYFQCSDAKLQAPSKVDLAICIGATHAYGLGSGAWRNTLMIFSRLVRPGGLILVGEGYWRKPPDPDYLAFLGDNPGIEKSHRENIASAEAMGLIPMYTSVSNLDEWDHFEWNHRLRIEREGLANPHDPKVQKKVTHSRRCRAGYLKWGRDTMGFGFYLFGVPVR